MIYFLSLQSVKWYINSLSNAKNPLQIVKV